MQGHFNKSLTRPISFIRVLITNFAILALIVLPLNGCTSAEKSAKQAYREICDELIEQYGECSPKESIEDNVARRYLDGLCYAELIDFDLDGKEELLVAYESDGSYTVEIVSYQNGQCKREEITPSYLQEYLNDREDFSQTYIITSSYSNNEGQNVPLILLGETLIDGQSLERTDKISKNETTSIRVLTFSPLDGLEEIANFEKSEYLVEDPEQCSTSVYQTTYKVNGSAVTRTEFESDFAIYQRESNSRSYAVESILYRATPERLSGHFGFSNLTDFGQEATEQTRKTLESLSK